MSNALLRPVATLMCGRAFGFVAALAVPIVLVRLLDQAEFGTYKQLFLVYATVYGIVQFGLAESLFYFLPTDPARAGRYAANATVALSTAGALSLALIVLGREPLAQLLGNPALVELLPLLGALLMLALIATPLEIVLTARERHAAAATAYAASDWAKALLLVGALALFGSLEALMFGALLFAMLRCALALICLHRAYPGALTLDAALALRQAAYALPFGAAVLVEVAHANLHSFVVATRVDAATFAVYAIGCMQVPLVDLLMSSTGNVLMVRMRAALPGDRAAALAVWHEATRKLALVLVPLAAFLCLAASELVTVLFTADYAASVPVFRAWTLGILAAVLLTDAALRVHAATRTLLAMNLVRLGLLLALLGWALDVGGLVGAALVTVLTTWAAKLVALARIAALLGCGLRALLPWAELAWIAAAAALAAAPALALRSAGLGPLATLLFAALVYAAVYSGLLLLAGRLRAVAAAPPLTPELRAVPARAGRG